MAESLEKIRRVKKDAERELSKIPGVTGVGIGRGYKGGEMKDEIGIVVYVTKKKKEKDIPANELIPKELDGIKVDVYELKPNPVSHGQALGNSVVGGIPIGSHVYGEGGTLGAIVVDKRDGHFLILSSCHVLRPGPNSNRGDEIYSPVTDATNVIAQLWEGDITGPVDAAVANVLSTRSTDVQCAIGNWPIAGKVDENEIPTITRVKKFGNSTGVTTGTIVGTDFGDPPGQPLQVPYPHWGPRNLVHQIIIRPDGDRFSAEGDSGSAILDESNRVVGLLMGGDKDPQESDGRRYSYANHVQPVLDYLSAASQTKYDICGA